MAGSSNTKEVENTKAPVEQAETESLGILSRKTFEFKDNHVTAKITVKAASYVDGAVRQLLENRAKRVNAAEEVNNLADLATQIVRLITYPMIAAATTEVISEQISWPMEFEDFVELPEALGTQWEAEILALNPSWKPKMTPNTPAEVKAEKEKKKGSSD